MSVITATEEQKVKSQPNNLYQFPGLLFGQPGITYDPGGYVHIRGSDLFQVGFQLDGISIINPITNEFGTNLVTVGLKSANFYTNGADASYGGATGGFINEITSSGRDLHAQGVKGITEVTVGPGSQWHYMGTNTQFGDVTPDGKFDYYLSTIRFRNHFPPGFGVTNLPDSQDTAVKSTTTPTRTTRSLRSTRMAWKITSAGRYGALKIQQPTFNAARQRPIRTARKTTMSSTTTSGTWPSGTSFSPAVVHQLPLLQPVQHPGPRTWKRPMAQYRKDRLHQPRPSGGLPEPVQPKHSSSTRACTTCLSTHELPCDHRHHCAVHRSRLCRLWLQRPQQLDQSGGDRSCTCGGELKPSGDKLTIDLGGRYASRGYRNIKRYRAVHGPVPGPARRRRLLADP